MPETTGPVTDELQAAGRRAAELDRAHVFHSWSAQDALSPMTVLAAEGSAVWDGEGARANRRRPFLRRRSSTITCSCRRCGYRRRLSR